MSAAPKAPPVRFAAIGLNHSHIYGQTRALLDAGAELAAFHAEEDDLAAGYAQVFSQARRVQDKRAILEDRSIAIVVSATVPDVRAATAIEVMRHGKDVMVDKPGVISLDELDCQAEPLPYGPQLLHDVLHRTETAMSQQHCFLATELALTAEAKAVRIDGPPTNRV